MDVREQLQQSLGNAYTLERELGGGGMSRVFVADEVRLRRKVVVKLLSPELAAGVSAERFEREIQLAASLQQANIVPVLSAGDSAGIPFYTMPYVEGQSLRARLAAGPLEIGEAVGILRDVARALAYAHAHGVVHRDIKPDNVLVSGGTAVVTDFGIAKAIAAAKRGDRAEGNGRSDPATSALTSLGMSMGTPAYMAPEQVAGDPNADHRADLYSFGCMAYEFLTGHSPFGDRSPQRMLAAHIAETPRPVAEVRPDVPPSLAQLVMSCLEKDPGNRPQTADDVVRALDAVSGATGAQPVMLATPQMVWKAIGVYVAAFVLVAVLTRVAMEVIGLPDWVFPGALVAMALGLPIILFAAYTQRVASAAAATQPALTPNGSRVSSAGPRQHLSWRRAASYSGMALAAFVLIVAGYMTLRALGVGPAGSLLAAGRVKQNERVLVADFGVRGGADTSLASVVSEAVRTDLSQSNVLSLVPASEVRGALQRMQRSPDTRVDVALAREIAQREGIRAIIDGEVTPVGAGFIVTGRIRSAESGDVLASFQETADGPRDLIATVEKVSRDLRGKIGESLKTVRATPRLEDVTTGSLEALRKYAAGVHAAEVEVNYPKALELLREAVALDSSFGMAWRKLAVTLRNSGASGAEVDSAAARAYRLRDRLTERERYNTIGYYYQSGPEPDRAKAVEAYEALASQGIVDASTHNLAMLLTSRREFARAESLYRKRIAAGDAPYVTYTNLAYVLGYEGKFAEAESLLHATERAFPNATPAPTRTMTSLYRRGQLDSLQQLARTLQGSSDAGTALAGRALETNLDFLHGRVKHGLEMFARLRGADTVKVSPGQLISDSMVVSLVDAWLLEQPARAARRLDAVTNSPAFRSLSPLERRYPDYGLAYALAGRPDRSRAMLAAFDAAVQDTSLRRRTAPDRHLALGEILLAEGKPLDALREFRLADRLPDGPAGPCAICVAARVGRAFDLANMPDSAIAAFESYMSTPDPNRINFEIDPFNLAPIAKRLGELYDAKGDRVRAAAYYQKFVSLWAGADAELQPKVEKVRQRLAELGDPEPRAR